MPDTRDPRRAMGLAQIETAVSFSEPTLAGASDPITAAQATAPQKRSRRQGTARRTSRSR